MKLAYTIADPTGNITILVEPGVPVEEQARISALLLKAEPAAEQVGFLLCDSGCDISVRMGGGEFCGNASLSAAALYCSRTGREGRVNVKMSGCEDFVAVDMFRTENGFRGTASMPVPHSLRKVLLPIGNHSAEFTLVDFGGIAHLVDPVGSFKENVSSEIMREWCGILGAEALGIMSYETAASSLDPIVYVRDIDTLYHERSCASGTTALGAVLAAENAAPVSVSVSEPGGILGISAMPGGELRLSGNVRLISKKTMIL